MLLREMDTLLKSLSKGIGLFPVTLLHQHIHLIDELASFTIEIVRFFCLTYILIHSIRCMKLYTAVHSPQFINEDMLNGNT